MDINQDPVQVQTSRLCVFDTQQSVLMFTTYILIFILGRANLDLSIYFQFTEGGSHGVDLLI